MTEMPWACVMDSVSASLSIRLVLFCLSACICPPPPKLLPLTIFFLPSLYLTEGQGHPGRRGSDIEPIGNTENKKRFLKKEKRVDFFPLICLDTPCPLPAPSLPLSAYPSINHPSMLVTSGIMASSVTAAGLVF